MSKIEQVKVGEAELEYFSFGEGDRPFVIIPGVSTKSVMQSVQFIEAAFKEFRSTHRIYMFDRKKNIEKGYTLTAMAEDTARAMLAVGISDADIFGASQGGMITMYIAAHHPELAHKIVLGSTSARSNPTIKATLARWVGKAREGDIVGLHDDFFRTIYTEEYYNRCKRAIPAFCREISPYDMEQFIGQAEASFDYSFVDDLDLIKCPVLVLGAKNDSVLTGGASLEIAEKLKCECYMYDAPYNHAVCDEAKDYRERILKFLLRAPL